MLCMKQFNWSISLLFSVHLLDVSRQLRLLVNVHEGPHLSHY